MANFLFENREEISQVGEKSMFEIKNVSKKYNGEFALNNISLQWEKD